MSRPLFSLPVRIYWEDTDAGGVVYHARYVQYLERSRSDWLRELGVVQTVLRDEHDALFAVRSVDIDFIAPARMDDLLDVRVDTLRAGRASIDFVQSIRRRETDALIATAKVRVACLSASRFRPAPIPELVSDLIAKQAAAAAHGVTA